MKSPNWSVVLIARNEEKTLPRLLRSLDEFKTRGGEVVLVDTGSTDKTAEVARNWGVKVTEVGDRFRRVITAGEAFAINERFVVDGEEPVVNAGDTLFDYSSARNFAASLAKNDMVAMPDCDEIYTTLNLERVVAAIDAGAEQLEYEFVFSHDEQGNPRIQFTHCKFYNRTKLRWTGIIHEILTGSANRKYLDQAIIKLEHWQNHETNRTGYLKGLALDCFENPDNDRNSHYFGRELVWTGRPKSAIRELERHVAMDKWEPERSQSAVFIGEAYKNIGDEQKAVEWWHRALQIHAGRRAPLIALMDHFYKKGDAQRAALYGEAALAIGPSSFYANDASHYRHVPHEALYWAHWNLGDRSKSKYHWEKCLEFSPTNSKYLHDTRFYVDLPGVDIVLPTLGRQEGLKIATTSVENLNYPKEKVNLAVFDGEGTVPEKVKKMVELTSNEWICFASNDIEFERDSLILAVLHAKKTGKKFIILNTGNPNEAEHFIIHRSLLPKLEDGLIFHTDFYHVGCDNWLWEQCKALGEDTRCDAARVKHFHFSRGGKMDDVYAKGWSHAEEDRATLKAKLARLHNKAD